MAVRGGRTAAAARREGWVSLWALLVLTTLLTALSLAVNAGWLSAGRQELQSAADAAALAGAGRLVSDEWLRQGRPGVPALLDAARVEARDFARLNRALGRSVELRLDGDDPDVVIGRFDANGAFVPAPVAPDLSQTDIVYAIARRLRSRNDGVPVLLGGLVLTPSLDVQAAAFARLDRDVVGFRATLAQPVPLAPIGVPSDPTRVNVQAWEGQIVDRQGPDEYAFDPATGFTQTGDGIPEIDIRLPLTPDALAAGDASLLNFGGSPPAGGAAILHSSRRCGTGEPPAHECSRLICAGADRGRPRP